MEPSKRSVIEAVRRQRARTVALARELSDAEWETIALPGWRVREVVGHLVASDAGALTGRMLRMGMRPRSDGGLAAVEQWNEQEVRRWSERPVPELVDGLERWGRRIVRVFAATPSAILARRIPLPFGKVPLLWLGEIRVFDEWVHEQDIRRALARPATDPAATAAAARMMLDVVPLQTRARIPDGSSGRVTLRFDDASIPAMSADLARATFALGEAANADAAVTGDAAALMMIAAGRDAWRDAERSGSLKVEGGRAVAEAFLDALRAA